MRTIYTLGSALILAAGAASAHAAAPERAIQNQGLEPQYGQASYATATAGNGDDNRWGKENDRKAVLDLCSQAVSQQTSGLGYARLGPVTQEIWKHWGFRIAGVFYIQPRQAQNSEQPGALRRGTYVCDTRNGHIQRLKLHGY